MDAMLFPYHTLEPYAPTDSPRTRQLEIAASLLYFDSVTLARVGWTHELPLVSVENLKALYESIVGRIGKSRLHAFREGQVTDGLSIEDVVILRYIEYCRQDYQFSSSYRPLLDAGVLRIASLASLTEEARKEREFVGADDTSILSLSTALLKYLPALDTLKTLPGDAESGQIFGECFTDHNGLELGCMYLRTMVAEESPELLAKLYSHEGPPYFIQAFLLDYYHQILLAELYQLPLLVFDENHLKLKELFLERLGELAHTDQPQAAEQARIDRLATQMLVGILEEVPTVIPKSPESILELREKLAPELQAFRQAVERVARNVLADAEKAEDVNKVRAAARAALVEPIRDLELKLAHPNRDLLRNLISVPAIASSIGTMLFYGLCAAAQPQAPLLAMTGLSGALLAGLMKHRSERSKAMDDSKVGFVIKAQQRIR